MEFVALARRAVVLLATSLSVVAAVGEEAVAQDLDDATGTTCQIDGSLTVNVRDHPWFRLFGTYGDENGDFDGDINFQCTTGQPDGSTQISSFQSQVVGQWEVHYARPSATICEEARPSIVLRGVLTGPLQGWAEITSTNLTVYPDQANAVSEDPDPYGTGQISTSYRDAEGSPGGLCAGAAEMTFNGVYSDDSALTASFPDPDTPPAEVLVAATAEMAPAVLDSPDATFEEQRASLEARAQRLRAQGASAAQVAYTACQLNVRGGYSRNNGRLTASWAGAIVCIGLEPYIQAQASVAHQRGSIIQYGNKCDGIMSGCVSAGSIPRNSRQPLEARFGVVFESAAEIRHVGRGCQLRNLHRAECRLTDLF